MTDVNNIIYDKAGIEYCQYLYDRIRTKLIEANEYKLLNFALCGIHLKLRQSDILDLEWSQFDFRKQFVFGVVINKNNNIVDIELNNKIIEILKIWKEKSIDKVKVFPNLKRYEAIEKIRNITGILNFNGHMLRQIGIILLEERREF